MKRKPPKRRNPLARVVTRIRPKVVKSAKAYQRHDKHKGRSGDDQGGLSLFLFQPAAIQKGPTGPYH